MSTALIGHTGFVGGSLLLQTSFTHLYRSTNIEEIEGKEFDLLVISGVSAMKWWANKNAEEDRKRIDKLIGHLLHVNARRVFVISTVDVYPVTHGADEGFDCHTAANHAYGTNRLHFEEAMQQSFDNPMIARLGGLFGPGLKKNAIYDLMHDTGVETINLESTFQFYDMSGLWRDLLRMEERRLSLGNFVTEPVSMREVVDAGFPGKTVGSAPSPRAMYDIRTLYAEEMGASGDYLTTKQTVLEALAKFVKAGAGS